MSTDVWTGTGNWLTNARWSLGAPPTSTQDAYIQSGGSTLYNFGKAHSLQVDAAASLTTAPGSTLTVYGYFANNSGGLGVTLQGQTTVVYNLINSNLSSLTLLAPASVTTTPTSLTVGNLVNNGALLIQGGYQQALLSVKGSASGGLTGSTRLTGNALLKYAGSGYSVVNLGATLELDGPNADVTFANVSLLTTLAANFGQLLLRGAASGGVTANVAGGFLNQGLFGVDDVSGSGGSQIAFGGAYINAGGTTVIGNSALSAATSAHFGSLVNQGALFISGNASGGAATTVTVDAAAPVTVVGTLSVAGAASLAFGSGGISSVQFNSRLYLTGSGAHITSLGDDAIAGLTANYGELGLEGNVADGGGGVATHFAGALKNYRSLEVDAGSAPAASAGGSAVVIDGAAINYGYVGVGNAALSSDSSLDVGSLINQGRILIAGAADNSARATLSTHSAANASIIGEIGLQGAATLQFDGGQVVAVQYGSGLSLTGSGAQVTNGAGSALQGLRINYGALDFEGGDQFNGQGGAQAHVSDYFTNTGLLSVDTMGALGGSHIVFNNAIANYGYPTVVAAAAIAGLSFSGGVNGIRIGNADLSANTLVEGASFLNQGLLDIQGSATANFEAKLAISGPANPALTGDVTIAGDAALQYGSGAISSVQYGSALHLFGSGARILSGAGSAFGAATPVYNYGQISLDGDIGYRGAGGAGLDFGGDLNNYGQLQLDAFAGGAESSLTVAGALINHSVASVGGGFDPGAGATPATLQTGSLQNYASLSVGNFAFEAQLVSLGNVVNSGSLLIGAVGSLIVQGGATFTQSAGVTNVFGALSASSLTVNGGKVVFRNGLSAVDAIGAFHIGLAGDLAFNGPVESYRTLTFDAGLGTLELTGQGFAGSISGWKGQDIIDITDLPAGGYTSYSYAGNSTSGTLTINLSAGGSYKLKFQGAYTTNSFRLLDDGHGGTAIVVGSLDVWSGFGDWDADAGNWDAGVPTAAKSAVVSAFSSLSASGVDNVGSLSVLSQGQLTATAGSNLTVNGNLDNHGTVAFQSTQSQVTGALTNNVGAYVTIDIGSGASKTVTAGSLYNQGYLNLYGAGGPSPTAKAKLSVAGAARVMLTGSVALQGNSELHFGSGVITSVANDASLSLFGGLATISSGSGSALAALMANDGNIDLEGNIYGYQNGDLIRFGGGVSLQATGGFTNSDTFNIDTNPASGGGSQVSFSGSVANTGTWNIGNANLTDDTLVTVGALKNQGELQIRGGQQLASPHGAKLAVNSNASGLLTGNVFLGGKATIQYNGGVFTGIQYGASLTLLGQNAGMTTAGGGASPLSGLRSNAGVLALEGNLVGTEGGATLTTSSSFSNYHTLNIDAFSGLGGSQMTVNGAFLNTGEATVGNESLAADTTLAVASLNNQGKLTVDGALSGPKRTRINVTAAAAGAITGDWLMRGNASVNFLGGGQFSSVQYGASLELDGAGATINAGGLSALRGLTLNAGYVALNSNSSSGSGSVTLHTLSSLVNSGSLSVDIDGTGGSAITVDGVVTNSGQINVGNGGGTTATSLSFGGFVNEGYLSVLGGAGPASTTVTVNQAAAGALSGSIFLAGHATLAYASGGFNSVQYGSNLMLWGADAKILGGASSALRTLRTNYGVIDLESGGNWGAPMSVSLNQSLTNYGSLLLDAYSAGGTAVSMNGLLTNNGSIQLGNFGENADTTLTANGVNNAGFLGLTGGPANASKLDSNGNFVTRGQIVVNRGGVIDASGFTFTQYAGSTTIGPGGSLLASNVQALGGTLEFADQVAAAGGLGALTIGPTGDVQFDAGVDAGRTVTFAGSGGVMALASPTAFHGTLQSFDGADAIDLLGVSVSGMSYSGTSTSGTLTVHTSAGDAALAFTGSYTTASFATLSDGAGGTKLLMA